jgi:Ras-related protein Rab-2A
MSSWDYIAKIVSIGDSATGKSSLTIRLCEGRFQSAHDVTIGVEFGSRIVPVGPPASHELNINNPVSVPSEDSAAVSKKKQKYMKLSLWDTAGQETYRSITRSYFRGASGALLVFDITRRSSFESATAWLNDLRQIAEEGLVIVLVGNKSDLDLSAQRDEHPFAVVAPGVKQRKREVSVKEAQEWAKANGILVYVETSAKEGTGVERAFREVAERIWQGIEAGRYNLDDKRSGVKRAGAVGGGSGNIRVGGSTSDNTGGGGCC